MTNVKSLTHAVKESHNFLMNFILLFRNSANCGQILKRSFQCLSFDAKNKAAKEKHILEESSAIRVYKKGNKS